MRLTGSSGKEVAIRGVLKNFSKFKGKHQCQSLCFSKVADSGCNVTKDNIYFEFS